MNTAEMLTALKVDLGITTDAYDARLTQLLTAAGTEIEREGIHLDETLDDCNLQIRYALWMWRRRDSERGMPRMLRYQLNNRLFAEKVNNNG